MKKLLIAIMSVATLFSVAKADTLASDDFESATVGSNLAVVDSAETGTWAADAKAADDVFGTFVANTESGDVGGLTLGAKSLNVQAEKQLQFRLNENPSTTTDFTSADLYFDALVQFTVSDSAPTQGLSDKLIVWLYQGEEAEATPVLKVLAGTDTPDGGQQSANYDVTNVEIQPDSWHRLTIKVCNDDALSGEPFDRFEIFVDGTKVTAVDPADESETVINTFPSLLPINTAGQGQLTAAVFEGSGKIDQLLWTNVDPIVPAEGPYTFVATISYPEAMTTASQDPSAFAYWLTKGETAGDLEVFDFIVEPSTVDGVVSQVYDAINIVKADCDKLTLSVELAPNASATGFVKGAESQETPGWFVWTKEITAAELAEMDAGDGSADDQIAMTIVVTAEAPQALDFTINTEDLPAGVTVEWALTEDAEAWNPASQAGQVAAAGDRVYLKVTNADGVTKIVSQEINEADTVITVDTQFGWADYLGEAAVDGAYEIDTEAELVLFQKGVAAGFTTADTTFRLTANIALTAAWPGIGVYNKDAAGTAFQGTFDGDGYTISNVVFANGATNKYRGFFNQLWGATVTDLTVIGSGFENTVTGDFGGAILAGHAKNTAFVGCTTKGSFENMTHNAAGMVCHLNNSTFTSCTNEANVSGSCTKAAGFTCLVYTDATFDNCVNKGNVTAVKIGSAQPTGDGGYAGFVGYPEAAITFKDCSNTGVMSCGEGVELPHDSVSNFIGMGQFVGKNQYDITASGTNTGRADFVVTELRTDHQMSMPGFDFATVDGNVATYVSTLTAGNTYLVTAKSGYAAKQAPIPAIELAAEEFISFNVSLNDDFDDSGITMAASVDAEAYELTKAEEGDVWTYTVTAKATGPEFVIIGEKSAQEMADEANSESGISISGGEASAEMIDVDPVTGETTITVGGVSITLPKFYNVAVNASADGFDLSLNDSAKPVIDEAEIAEETKPAIEVVDGQFKVTVKNPHARLFYSLYQSDEANGTFTYVSNSEVSNPAGSFQFSVDATAAKKFFKIVVTDKPIVK